MSVQYLKTWLNLQIIEISALSGPEKIIFGIQNVRTNNYAMFLFEFYLEETHVKGF